MRSEGWLMVSVAGAKPVRRYVLIDGYILRLFAEEPLQDSHRAVAPPVDLRRATSISPVDVYSPGGPCAIDGVVKLTLAPVEQTASSEDAWWLRHAVSAVADRICAPSLRKYRDDELVLAAVVLLLTAIVVALPMPMG